MKKHKVYKNKAGMFFSKGVSRAFGENRVIHLDSGGTCFCAVDQLVLDESSYDEFGLVEIGFIVDGD